MLWKTAPETYTVRVEPTTVTRYTAGYAAVVFEVDQSAHVRARVTVEHLLELLPGERGALPCVVARHVVVSHAVGVAVGLAAQVRD